MATEEQIVAVLMHLAKIQACRRCKTRLRWGDVECPHCGADIEDTLRQWAIEMVEDVSKRVKEYRPRG